MSSPSATPWSNNPNAPQYSHRHYFGEKMVFAGVVLGAIFYGIVVVMFFRCMAALLDPSNRKRGGIKWALVVHTVVMFSLVTTYTATVGGFNSNSFINNRGFPGTDGLPPGPFGYQYSVGAGHPIELISLALNGWLADGLLLYRCYIIYTMNYWAIAIPGLMYLTSVATGVVFICQFAIPLSAGILNVSNFGPPYYWISLFVNVVLTLMIVARLIRHHITVQRAMGAQAPAVTGGLYKAIVTILVESCALYAVTYLLFLVPWTIESPFTNAFFPILAQTQVIAPFLITLRVAHRRDSPDGTTDTKDASSMRFESRGASTSGGSGTAFGGGSTSSAVVVS